MEIHLITAVINIFWLIADNHFLGVLSESPEEWDRIAQAELQKALNIKQNTRKAKNIIFFLGDGMGISTLTSGRIYKGQLQGKSGEEGSLVFEQFPHLGLSKTYNDDSQIPDSAGTATAYFCGQKADIGVIGVDSTVKFDNCSSMTGHTITSVLKWAQDYGKATGVVTTTRITHATPAGTYAHTPNRDWEADSNMPAKDRAMCSDIAKQLIDDIPGRKINVIMGGGSLRFVPNNETDVVSGRQGVRLDGQNLMEKWKRNKADMGAKAQLITNRDQLNDLALDNDYVLGLFSGDHIEYELKRERLAPSQPSLTEMTKKAIELLLKKSQGFFLAVEGGRIDLAHHENHAKLALHELYEFDRAIQTALGMVPLEDTLIIVTADHSHSFTMNGYAERGNDIFKFAGVDVNGWPYTTLSYANGPSATDVPLRRDLTAVDTANEAYRQESLVPLLDETHGGEDVAIYAQGPFSHLFHSLHEQNYIAHVMDYAGCYRKQYGSHCSQKVNNNGTAERDRTPYTFSKGRFQ